MSTTELAHALPLVPTYGKREIPETAPMLTDARMRKWRDARPRFAHRTPNRHNDPFSYFHIVRWLLQVRPWEEFNAKSLAHALNQYEPATQWDPVTVGRIINDIAESAAIANPGDDMLPIWVHKTWAGMRYKVSHSPAARQVLANLLDDLVTLGNALVEDELRGLPQSRSEPLLARCPSLALPAEEKAA